MYPNVRYVYIFEGSSRLIPSTRLVMDQKVSDALHLLSYSPVFVPRTRLGISPTPKAWQNEDTENTLGSLLTMT